MAKMIDLQATIPVNDKKRGRASEAIRSHCLWDRSRPWIGRGIDGDRIGNTVLVQESFQGVGLHGVVVLKD